MEVALRRRLEGVTGIAISQSQQTVSVGFDAGSASFSPDSFREAIGEASVEVLTMTIEACGVLEERDSAPWLVAGANRFRVANTDLTADVPTCLTGTLTQDGDVLVLAALATGSSAPPQPVR